MLEKIIQERLGELFLTVCKQEAQINALLEELAQLKNKSATNE